MIFSLFYLKLNNYVTTRATCSPRETLFSCIIMHELIFQMNTYTKILTSQKKRNETGIWQRRYYAHIIREDKDLFRHVGYIHHNSVKHYNIMPIYWKYSSFIKLSKNWYNMNWCFFND